MTVADSCLLGFDIGGTKCAVVLAWPGDPPGIVERRAIATRTRDRGPEAIIAELCDIGRDLLKAHRATAQAIGISCGGPLDRVAGVVLGPPNLPGWDRVPIAAMLGTAFSCPAALEHDGAAGAIAEQRWGAARGCSQVVFITCGTGLGAGILIDGKPYSGGHGLAGEVGHVRLAADGPLGHGKFGSFEGFCSGTGIAELGRRRAHAAWTAEKRVAFAADEAALATLDTAALATAARAGDSDAMGVFAESGTRLGQGLALIIDLLDPEVVVIGGVFGRCRDLLWPTAASIIDAEVLAPARVRVEAAALGETIGDYACLAAARPTREARAC